MAGRFTGHEQVCLSYEHFIDGMNLRDQDIGFRVMGVLCRFRYTDSSQEAPSVSSRYGRALTPCAALDSERTRTQASG